MAAAGPVAGLPQEALDTESATPLVPRSPSNIVQLKHHLTNAASRLTSVSINAKLDIVLVKHGKPNLSMGRFLFLDRRAEQGSTTTSSYIGQNDANDGSSTATR